MDRNRFNTEVRPFLTKIPIGQQGIAFDRLELDAWVEDCISRNGRPAKRAGSGTLKSAADMHTEDGSEKARAHLLAVRQSKS
jgi:hypothetical protein